MVEGIEEWSCPALFITQSFSLSAANLSLRRILVKALKQGVQVRRQIELMETVRMGLTGRGQDSINGAHRAKFHITEFLMPQLLLQEGKDSLPVCNFIKQRLAVVGEGKRNQAMPRQPAIDTADDKAIAQGGAGRRRRQNGRFVSIAAAKRLEPRGAVEDSGPGMSLQELLPPGIGEGIHTINH